MKRGFQSSGRNLSSGLAAVDGFSAGRTVGRRTVPASLKWGVRVALLAGACIVKAQPASGDGSAVGSLVLAPPGAAAWVSAALPAQKLPPTRFDLREVDGRPAWSVESPASYGNLVHAVQGAGAQARTIAWRWRLDRAIERADLLTKAGDDAALKVCLLFDMPADRVPFVERQLLRVARAASGQSLPAATLCYVWAPLVSAGAVPGAVAGAAGGTSFGAVQAGPTAAVLPNAHTRRMRWMVLRGSESPLGTWQQEQRDLRADFLRAFGDETTTVPPLMAVLVGADADNTGGHGLGWLQDLTLRP